MATTIKLKNGSGAPLAGDLVAGEPALDLTNKRLYTEDTGGTVIEVGTNPSTIDINAGTIDGTVIGGASAAAGTFTNLTATGTITFANDSISGDDVDGGTISNFASTGIDDNATSTAITIDSSQNVGIGTASPSAVLDVSGDVATDTTLLNITGTAFTAGETIGLAFVKSGAELASVRGNNVDGTNGQLIFETSATERVRIDSSGNVGIGTNNPDAPLTITEASNVAINILKSSGNSLLKIGEDGSNHAVYNALYNEHIFQANGSERMRIDNSGTLLIGKDFADNSTVGIRMNSTGDASFCADGNRSLVLNRKTSDGDLAIFLKDNTTVGSIGVTNTLGVRNSYISGTLTGLSFGNATIFPTNQNGASSDNAKDLGTSSIRFDDIYATNGTIQTSDANEKQDIEALSEAETRVAVAAKALLRKFRWKSAVRTKTNDARIHFGIIAQDLQTAFEAEGLDAGRYGMFIHSTWTDEETGEERSRMGVRYSELLAFIIAAI